MEIYNENGVSKKKITIASILGCVITLQLGAFSVTLETLASGITKLSFGAFVSVMQPIHLAIGLVEGIITACVLVFVYEARPELLWGIGGSSEKLKNRFSLKKTVAILAAAAVVIAGGLSLAASQYPDGLEWSIENLQEIQNLKLMVEYMIKHHRFRILQQFFLIIHSKIQIVQPVQAFQVLQGH